jgi:glycosyltransferase involved in cell wall biosynthesis
MVSAAVVIPALDEEKAIGRVVGDFKRMLPHAVVVVCDNGSSDGTAELARKAGAVLVSEPRRGKGFALKAALSAVDSDIYVLVDGDGTYSAEAVGKLIRSVEEGECDMAVGSRSMVSGDSMKKSRFIGNMVFCAVFNLLYGTRFKDVLSGYRVLNRGLMERLRLTSGGFEVECEITALTLSMGMKCLEYPVTYLHRHRDSHSKLRFFRDGLMILWTAVYLSPLSGVWGDVLAKNQRNRVA